MKPGRGGPAAPQTRALETRSRGLALAAAALVLAISASLHAQGILTVTPGRALTTSAGTGIVGYTGDGGAATSATVSSPTGIAYDANGNLYLADAQNHVVREISRSGQITTVAGTGVEGYGGDNGPATSAFLDSPTGIAIDAAGTIYIADSHNHRIRKVSGGIIATIAGIGTPGFSGDDGPATAAQLDLPTAVAVDASGSLYIADTNNQRIRSVRSGTITTLAGDGEELFGGDGAIATAAALDSPTGIAVDATGNVYIADRHNQRVRMVTPSGTITTIAGSGSPSFAGGFSGDGTAATSALLAKPTGVSVDAAGNIYIADSDNQRIRQLGGGAIATIVGSGQQGFGGDGATFTSVNLNMPRAAVPDALGDIAVSDTRNQRIRAATLATLTFASDDVGILSPSQAVTLLNTGTASITVASLNLTGPFTTAAGGSCSAPPITLAANASCTEAIAYLPVAVGAASGSVVFAGTGIVPQTILLAGLAAQGNTLVTLISSIAEPGIGQAITFTSTVRSAGSGTPTGSVSFYDGAARIGTAQPLVSGSASITTTTLTAGTHNITAVYSGDANFATSTSAVLMQSVAAASFTLTAATIASQTVVPGQPVTYSFALLPLNGAFPYPVTLSASGLPSGATAIFTPNPVTIGASPVNFSMTIQTVAPVAALFRLGSTIALGFLLLPFCVRRRSRRLAGLTLCAVCLFSLAAIGGLAGCGAGGGFLAQPPQTYTITVVGTASTPGGVVVQRVTTVTLTVQ